MYDDFPLLVSCVYRSTVKPVDPYVDDTFGINVAVSIIFRPGNFVGLAFLPVGRTSEHRFEIC